MKKEVMVLLVTLVIAVVLVVGLFALKAVKTPERDSGVEEAMVEEGGAGSSGSGGSTVGSGQGEREKVDLSKKKKVDSKQNLLEAIYDEESSKQMKDHLKAIRESSR